MSIGERYRRWLLATDPVAARSPVMTAVLGRLMQAWMRRGFEAVRLAEPGVPVLPHGRPVVIFTNHPSWWDPVLFAVLTVRLLAGRRGFGAMSIEALARYPVLSRIGLFALEPASRRGGARLLRTGTRILDDPRAVLWITPQGRFADPRERPVRLLSGVAHLARHRPQALMVPMAIEYVFWNTRRPEALCRFGAPIDAAARPGAHARVDTAALTARLEAALTLAMDRLADDALARQPERFSVILPAARLHGNRRAIGARHDRARDPALAPARDWPRSQP